MYYFDALKDRGKVKKGVDIVETNTLLNTPRPPLPPPPSIVSTVDLNPVKVDIPKHMNELYVNKEITEETLKAINIIVDEIYERDPNQISYVKRLAEFRGLDPQPLLDNKCFLSPNPEYIEGLYRELNLYRRIYHISSATNTLWKDRLITPVRDFKGSVYGFVGYSAYSNTKYVEYSSPVYKKTTIKALGLDRLDKVLESKYCIFTEGNFDYFRGIQHDLSIVANLGIKFNPLLKPLIDKLDVVFTAYDNDKTGIKNMNMIDNLHPNVYHIRFNKIMKNDKEVKGDLDEALKDLDKVEKLKVEINQRLKFKTCRLPHIKI